LVDPENGRTFGGQHPDGGALDLKRPIAGGEAGAAVGADSESSGTCFYCPERSNERTGFFCLGVSDMRGNGISPGHQPSPESPGEGALITFDQLLLGYLNTRRQTKSWIRDCNAAQHLFPVFTERMMCQVQPLDIRQYIRMREDEGAAASTINKEIGLLSRAINYTNREWGMALYNPTQGCKRREPEGRVRWLTRAEARRLIVCARQLGPRAAHLPELIALAVHTGMRKGELLGLEWNQVDFVNGLIYLEARHTKSNRRRSIPLNQPARAALAVCQARFSGRFVFGGVKDVKRSFAHACRVAGIENFRFHDLRHTFASWLVQAGAALPEVRDLLGHSSIEMTERYAHLAPERLRGAVARLDG